MATVALSDHSKLGKDGDGHRRRDLKTVINYTDQEAYLKLVKEDPDRFDIKRGSKDGMLPKLPPFLPRDVVVEDIGGREAQFTLAKNGFMLAKQTNNIITTTEDLTNHGKIKHEYYPMMEAWLKKVTGADRVLVYHHGTRISTTEMPLVPQDIEKGAPAPAVFQAHLDQTSWSAGNALHTWFPNEAEDLAHGRVVFVNAWRPIKTVYKDPFGIADASSVPHTDLCPRLYRRFSEIRETAAVKPNAQHRWFYKFAQQPDEVLIFKGYDNYGEARACPHSAFRDEEFEGARGRESIEIRAILLWPDHESVKGAKLPSSHL